MANGELIRSTNEARVLDLLRRERGVSRAEAARKLSLTRSTITNLVGGLLARDLVQEDGLAFLGQSTGRPGMGLYLNPSGAFFVGVEIGVTRLNIVLVGLDARVVGRFEAPIMQGEAPATVVARLIEGTRGLLNTHLINGDALKGVGVTVPGMLDTTQKVLSTPILGWKEVVLQQVLEQDLGVAVVVENDANAAAIAEYYFGEDQSPNFLYLMLDHGIGGGLVIGRRIYRGEAGLAGEVGNIWLAPEGPHGGSGTFEAFCGRQGLLTFYHQGGSPEGDLDAFFTALEAGDPSAERAVATWGTWLSRGITSLVSVLDPGEVILGGPLARLYPYVDECLLRPLRTERLPRASPLDVRRARFGADACALGGAAVIYQKLFEAPSLSEKI